MPDVTLYGDFAAQERAPIVSLNLAGEDSARVADILWEELRHLRAGRCALCSVDAQGIGDRRAGCGAVQLFTHEHRGRKCLQAAAAVRQLAQEE